MIRAANHIRHRPYVWGGGPGSWVRIYANREPVFAVIAGLRWDTTSEEGDGHGPGWSEEMRSTAASGCATPSASWANGFGRPRGQGAGANLVRRYKASASICH